ncbi:MAG: carbohydrate ABC transporter permease [Caldilineaceae bacterium]|nr:carbohydrate ABC transporter permease [Caldilineaceae bacterium]
MGALAHGGAPRRARQTKRILGRLALHGVMILLGLTFLLPMAWVVSTSLKSSGEVFLLPIQWVPSSPRWSNYAEVFNRLPFGRFILNSLYVTIMGTVGAVVSAITVAYGLSRIRWPGREFVFTILLATLMLPGVVTLIPVFIIFKSIGWIGTFLPLWAPAWFGFAFYIFLMRQFMMSVPLELDEAAKIDGASSFRILWQVIAPLCGPAIATVTIFAFLHHYNDFLGPLIYIAENDMFTLPLGLLWFQGRFGNFWHLVMAASVITIAPVVLLFFIAQRYFVQGAQFSGLAGR